MQISSTTYKHCDLVKIDGRVDSSTSPKLTDTLNEIMDSGRFKIVLDMSGMDFISSSGLRVLINTQKNCKRYNRGELVLSSVPATVFAALELAGFTSLFKIFDDSLTAVGNF